MKIRRIVVICLLLKGQQNLVCFCGRANNSAVKKCVFTADLWLTGRTVFLLLPWRCTRGHYVTSSWTPAILWQLPNCSRAVAAETLSLSLSLNSSHHVVAIANLVRTSCHHVRAIANLVLNSCHHVVAVACLFVNSCHLVVANLWARGLCHLTVEEARFRTRIILGVVLVRSLACV